MATRDVLDEDQRDEQDHADAGDHRVLAVEVGPRALLDGAGDALHLSLPGESASSCVVVRTP